MHLLRLGWLCSVVSLSGLSTAAAAAVEVRSTHKLQRPIPHPLSHPSQIQGPHAAAAQQARRGRSNLRTTSSPATPPSPPVLTAQASHIFKHAERQRQRPAGQVHVEGRFPSDPAMLRRAEKAPLRNNKKLQAEFAANPNVPPPDVSADTIRSDGQVGRKLAAAKVRVRGAQGRPAAAGPAGQVQIWQTKPKPARRGKRRRSWRCTSR